MSSKVEFKPKPHDKRPGVIVHEMWVDGIYIASVTPGDNPLEVRIMSAHIEDVGAIPLPGALLIQIQFSTPQ